MGRKDDGPVALVLFLTLCAVLAVATGCSSRNVTEATVNRDGSKVIAPGGDDNLARYGRGNAAEPDRGAR
jgi:hypothetical protein